MLRIAIASLFSKNKKYATNEQIQGAQGNNTDSYWFFH